MTANTVTMNAQAQSPDDQETALTRSRYQRIAKRYDQQERIMERSFTIWRKKLWQLVQGRQVLEVGVGTGKNISFWPEGSQIMAIDLTPGMLEIARQRLKELNRQGDLRLGDVQSLEFATASFDTVIATFVFCSVPDPILGLREVARVVRPGGQVLLLEHVRVDRPVIGSIMDLLAPLIVRLNGAHINRRTVENVRVAGLQIERVESLDRMGMFKLIIARQGA